MLTPVFTSPRAPGGAGPEGGARLAVPAMLEDRRTLSLMERLADRLDQIEFSIGEAIEASERANAVTNQRLARLEKRLEAQAPAGGEALERVAETNERLAERLEGMADTLAFADARLALMESRLDAMAARLGSADGAAGLEEFADRIERQFGAFGATLDRTRKEVTSAAREAIEGSGVSAAEAEQTALLARLNRQVLSALEGIGGASERSEAVQGELRDLLKRFAETQGPSAPRAAAPPADEAKVLRRLSVLNGQIAARAEALGEGPEAPALVQSIRRAIETILAEARNSRVSAPSAPVPTAPSQATQVQATPMPGAPAKQGLAPTAQSRGATAIVDPHDDTAAHDWAEG